jgi:hypothetical protein
MPQGQLSAARRITATLASPNGEIPASRCQWQDSGYALPVAEKA